MAVRVGFVGAGGIAGVHMSALEKIPDAQVVAVCDVDGARAKRGAERFGAVAYTSHHDMLDKEQLDALYVCVPPFAHTDAEVIAAQKGIALMIEKPIATSLEKAKEIEAAIKKAGVISSVAYNWRYNETTDIARQALDGKTVGMCIGYWMGGMPGVAWWRRMDGSGGQFVEQTTHIVDIARYLVGDIVEVSAYMTTRALHEVENFDVTDVGSVNVKFANGAIGTIHNTCLLKMGYTVALHVITPELIAEVSGTLRLIEPGKRTEITSRNNAYQTENEVFINAVKTGDASAIRSPYSDAVKTLAVTLAANESAAKGGQPVAVQV